MKVLVGSTGFVGSNLMKYGDFDICVHSTDVQRAYGTNPEFLVYSGVTAAKYIANKSRDKDREIIVNAFENIRKINPQKLVLISTIDVLDKIYEVDEDYVINPDNLLPYGLNRYELECMVRNEYKDALIVRLPGLFGDNIKKNLIYDYIHVIPFMLNEELFSKLSSEIPNLSRYYSKNSNGYYQYINDDPRVTSDLRENFKAVGFTALNFTDSRNVYQFYPLQRLYDDINIAIKNDIELLHLATEPISASDLIYNLSGNNFINETNGTILNYNYMTKYSLLFNGKNQYILSKEEIMRMIKEFVDKEGERI